MRFFLVLVSYWKQSGQCNGGRGVGEGLSSLCGGSKMQIYGRLHCLTVFIVSVTACLTYNRMS